MDETIASLKEKNNKRKKQGHEVNPEDIIGGSLNE